MEAVEDAVEICVDHLAPLFRGHLVEIRADLDGGGENCGIKSRIFAPYLIEQAGHGRFIRDVDLA